MQDSVCHFVPHDRENHAIQTIHFVRETRPQPYGPLKSLSLYRIYYVCSGAGLLHTAGRCDPLTEGDVFLTFPGKPFCIESIGQFKYLYIGFLGARGNQIMERIQISRRSFLFHGCQELFPVWKQGLQTKDSLMDLISESVLLYTFAYLGNRLLNESKQDVVGSDTVLNIKKYIDDHFTEAELSLDDLSSYLQYNKKYISYIFKKTMGIGVIAYLNQIRIQHACTLIRQGLTDVGDIAAQCGYTDSQYFSRLFRERIGMPPGKYIRSLNDKNQAGL